MKRRSLLSTVGLGIAVSTAGCLESAVDLVENSSRIGWIGVNNYDIEPHQFDVQVKRDGSIVHESSHETRGRDDYVAPGEAIDCTWGDTEGKHVIRARIDENEWVEQSIDEAIDGHIDCVTISISYGEGENELDIFVRENCEDVPEYNGGCEFAN